jgi:hypothetical protein
MFYICGKHKLFGNVLWVEFITTPSGSAYGIRPTVEPLFAEAFNVDVVEIYRRIVAHHYPEYAWQPVGADSSQLIPENMRKQLNIA